MTTPKPPSSKPLGERFIVGPEDLEVTRAKPRASPEAEPAPPIPLPVPPPSKR